MSAPDPYQQPVPPPPPPPPGPYYQPYQSGPEINGKAVAALVCGMLFVASPLGIMGLAFGKTAERQIDAGMGIGRPLAKAGRVLGWVSVGFTVFWALYFLIVIIAVIGAANAASNL
ncbi:DUF4190 domain-containing protein [Glycomyces sp. A-F 0318]|uniref:DUF4190 domain-containing protein n=1 Tax=Glycomyces amatae TaxID=2881355 RepID=UPI001E5720E3|nr:DUF4190 domain-containing protein [Glycomyces amatae]MCD0444683.1 DUF4190 domain-containing protein [Glycomyces amatae]